MSCSFACELLEREHGAVGLFYALVAPAFAAYGHVSLVAAYLHLLSLFDEVAVAVYAGIDYGLASARACGFYLVDCVGYLEEASGAFEEVALEVGAQTVAYHVAAEVVHHSGQLIYLVGCEELGLVHEKPVYHGHVLLEELLGHFIEVGVVVYPAAFTLNAYARAYDVGSLACVHDRFQTYVAHVALFKVVGGGEENGGLGRSHRAVAEI